jgi:hypothetical protein
LFLSCFLFLFISTRMCNPVDGRRPMAGISLWTRPGGGRYK